MDYQHSSAAAAAAAAVPSSQKPETFLLSPGAEQSLPQQAQIALQQVDNLKYFLISAPVDWVENQPIRRFLLPTGEYVSCVLWNNLFHITGTDIVRCLAFRFQAFGRPVKNTKKFEEGIFSDLRNLKAGNDASLEEPKSQFLDFLYKNNCIRTQKKQKVFYWFSVPHDRLFLDALERDLKREKAGQEPTTVAAAEPALSFEFDASQSLFDQLTKAQQETNTSVFNLPQENNYSQSASPVVRAADTMPPPPLVSDPMSNAPQESFNDKSSFSQMTMPAPAMSMTTTASNPTNRSAQPATHQPIFDRHGNPLPSAVQRQTSLPAYYEYSPAPSFVSSQSHHEDFSARGVSYEPVTPPQQNTSYAVEPSYVADGDSGLYATMPEMQQQYGSMNQMHSSSSNSQQCNPMAPSYPLNTAYSHVEGSPNYKQRRRGSSVTSNWSNGSGAIVKPYSVPRPSHLVRRPSDLRRSVSASVTPQSHAYGQRSSSNPPALYRQMQQYGTVTPDLSRQSSPMTSVESRQQSLPLASNSFGTYSNDGGFSASPQEMTGASAVFRRARSVTTSELFSPYGQKSHACPIPGCGRLFKRLEHLKRHVRTHTQERPYQCPHCSKAFSRSDNLAQHRRIHEEQGTTMANFTEPEEDEQQLPSVGEEDMDSPDGSFGDSAFPQFGGPLPGATGNMGPPLIPASMMQSY